MNYIKQINLFYTELKVKPVSGLAQALYFLLLHYSNLASWRSPISVGELVLRGELQITHKAFLKAREELKEGGYIEHVPRLGKKPAFYIIKDLEEDC